LLYIVVALKAEAQAFVEFYKLKKSTLAGYTLFYNENISLIVSGMGVTNARAATQALINAYDITDEDIYLNVGICGASREYAVGSLLEIGSVVYEGIEYTFAKDLLTIECRDEGVRESEAAVVDMESFGFYDAVVHNPAIQKFHILKIVSDHFEPERVSKDGSKMLIFKALNAINRVIYQEGA